MSGWLQDLRFGLRLLRRSPTVTVMAVLSLAVAIGANTAIFSVADAVLLQPVPAREPDRLLSLFGSFDDPNRAGGFFAAGLLPISYLNYLDYRRQTDSFQQLAAGTAGPVNLAGEGDPEQVFAGYVTGNYFATLGLEPLFGRLFSESEEGGETAAPVAVISERLWRARYGARQGIVGDEIRLNGRDYTVVGILPRGFRGLFTLSNEQLWLPVGSYPLLNDGFFAQALERRGVRMFQVVGRLAHGIGAEQARGEVEAIAARLAEAHPAENRGRGARLYSLAESALNPNQQGLFQRAGLVGGLAVGLVLLIACANVANLLITRSRGRRRELAMRLSLGAGRWRLARQLTIEGMLLSVLGGALGLLLAHWLRPALQTLRPPFMQQSSIDLSLDLRVLTFTAGVSIVTGLLFSILPALRASSAGLVAGMRARGATEGGTRFGARQALVALQVALAVVALVAAGLFVESLERARAIDPGFDADRLAVVGFDLGALRLDDEGEQAFLRALLEEVEARPEVSSAALASGAPLSFVPALRVTPEGSEEAAPEGTYVPTNVVTDGYFSTLGIEPVEGRLFDSRDHAESRPVVVVNRTLAERYWPDGSAVGRRIHWTALPEPFEIVGVVEDLKYTTLGEAAQPYMYRPLHQSPLPGLALHLRASGEPGVALAAGQEVLRDRAPELAVLNPQPVREVLEQSLWATSLGATLLASFGLMALVLAALGIYGVVAQLVLDRRREVGIRLAIGANRLQVLSAFLRSSMLPVLGGAALAIVALGPMARLTSGLLYESSSGFLPIYGIAVGILGLVALVATLFPAVRATRLDPTTTLRAD